MNILGHLIPIAKANSGDGSFGGRMMSDYGFMGMGGGYMGAIFMILFWILVLAGTIYLLAFLAQPRNGKQDKTPKEILKERYAKGEIDKEEFERKKKDLFR
jgi:putative membrane protein